jgi:hypothetical protein
MMDVSSIDVEPRLKQMLRPVSLVLSVFPDGESRLTEYVRVRQIEVRRERAASFDGLVFNLAVKLADGAEDLRDDSKFSKYYRDDGTLQAVEARMIAAALGVKRTAVSTSLRGMGFKVRETSIRYKTVGPAKENEQGKIGERKLTVSKVIVPDLQAWQEMVGRYYNPNQGEAASEGQTELDIAEFSEPSCPEVLRGPRFVDTPCDHVSGSSGTSGTDPLGASDSTGCTGDTGTVVTSPPLPTCGDRENEAAPGPDRYIFNQANSNPCRQCGAARSHYVASASGAPMIDMSDPKNIYLCRNCWGDLEIGRAHV